jgi:peptide/nickel transport system permease protein
MMTFMYVVISTGVDLAYACFTQSPMTGEIRFLLRDSCLRPALWFSVVTLVLCLSILVPGSPLRPLKISIASAFCLHDGTFIWTDQFGRDVLTRILCGTVSLQVGIFSVILGGFIGIVLGSIGGYFGGWIDNIIVLIMDTLISFPATILGIGFMAVMGPNIENTILALAVIGVPRFGRVVRGAALSIREKEYIEAARAAGSGHIKIIFLHILPGAIAPLIVVTTIGVANAILIEAALSFLGLGVPPPAPSWGNILADGRNFLTQAPWLTIFPGVAISLTVLGFNTFGDGLRDVLDPKLRNR